MSHQEKLITCFKLWDEAIVKNDVELMSQFMSDDWVCIGTEGGITSKAVFLGWINSGDLVHTRMDSVEMRIKNL